MKKIAPLTEKLIFTDIVNYWVARDLWVKKDLKKKKRKEMEEKKNSYRIVLNGYYF